MWYLYTPFGMVCTECMYVIEIEKLNYCLKCYCFYKCICDYVLICMYI